MRLFGAVTLGTLLLVAGGCVPLSQYEEALAANRRVNDELQRVQELLQNMRSETGALTSQLEGCQGVVKNKEADIRLLEAARKGLQQRFDELSARYAELRGGPKPAEFGPPVIRVLPEQVDKALKAFAEANPDLVEYLAKYGMVKLKADLTFERGSDYVQKDAQAALASLAKILNAGEAANFSVFVAGHTDDIPIRLEATRKRHPNNWYLSVHRAVAVQEVLMRAGLAPARTCAMGFGEYHPLAPNAPNQGGNKVNRRVEIWLVPADRFVTAPEAAPSPTD